MAGVSSVSTLARILPAAPTDTAPLPTDSASRAATPAASPAVSLPAVSSRAPSSPSPSTSSYGLLAPGVVSSLLQAQANARAPPGSAVGAVAAVRAYGAAQALPVRASASVATALLEGVVIYTS